MNRSFKKVFSAAFVLLSASACSVAPNIESNWGAAVESAKAKQIVNPEGTPGQEVLVDGQSVDASINKYHKSYSEKTKEVDIYNSGISD